MSFAATSRSAARGWRALVLCAAAVIAAAAALFGGVGGASATSLALCLTTVSAPTASPSSAVAGTPITYTATVTAASGCANGSPTGKVAFYSNYVVNGQPQSFQIGSPVTLQPSGTPGQSVATLTDNSLPRGSYAITASYSSSDESLFWDSGPSAGTSVVIQSNALTTTTMNFTLNPSTITVGDNVTFHVHVTPVDQNGNPTGAVATGTVHFSAGPTAASGQVHFASVQLDATGSLTFSYNGFVPGDYIVVASYSGDPVDFGISGQLPLTVLPATTPIPTTTTVVPNPSSISTSDTTTLVAHVIETGTQTPAPAGTTVNFFAGPNPTDVQFEGSAPLDSNGNAQLTVGNLAAGVDTVRAQYLGSGNEVAGSFGDNTVFVSAPAGGGSRQVTQIAYTGDVEGVVGTQATLTGHLEKGDGTPLSGKPLTLSMGSQSCTTAATNGGGDASCSITIAQGSGSYPATAAFAGDADWSAASASSTFTVDLAPTTLVYTGATSGASGSPATLSAHLTTNGSDLAGEKVTLVLDGQSCSGTTDAAGVASCSVIPTETAGTYPVAAHFVDTSFYLPSDDTATFTVTKAATTTTYTGATAGAHGASATLSAHLTGVPDGATVTFTFTVGSATCSGTVSGGDASCSVTLTDPVGSGYIVKARYAGDGAHLPSSDSKPFTIVSPTTTTHAGPVSPVLAGAGATLSATVDPAQATGTVTFSSGGATLCSGTLSGGATSCTATFAQPGSYTVTAHYDGDGVYPASSGTTSVLVYALAPGGGTFVVGDKSASGTVTFWGSQWAKVNGLSGSGAPDAFKGFGLNSATCGGTWTTDPGNSSPPPAGPLPAYMAVLVTSNAAKAGSLVYGNTVAIVIVQTDAGYKNDPGHAGTGTVIATLCTGPATLTKPATETSYTGPTQGSGGPTTLTATLTDAAGNPLDNEVVTLSAGSLSCSDKTDGKGNASCKVTLPTSAATYPVTASFAGDSVYGGSSDSATLIVGSTSTALDCKKTKCESLLADPTVNGRTLSLVYMDDSALKSVTVTVNGQPLTPTVTATSGQPQNYVDANGGSKSTKVQSLITMTLPAAGTYTVVVTAYDGDGDLDQYSWTVTVA
jgi:hypothetical protein